MSARLNYSSVAPSVMRAMRGLEVELEKSGLESKLLHLVKLRASQINGCAYCTDMHSKDLLAEGETLERLLVLTAWREAPFYSKRERVALAWAEAVTELDEVSDELYEQVRGEFSQTELVYLTLAVTAINAWNRFGVAFRSEAGTYRPQMKAAV
jgi:AhpD family alkylhydroperoxidase